MREALNSKILRANNKTLYRSFFANYPLVVSSPGGAVLTGTFTDHIGGPGLHQKVPLRNYLGLRIVEGAEITFESYGTYDYFTNSFVNFDIKREHIDKLKILQRMISEKLGKKIGLKAGVLNELPRRTGLNNPGSNAANLTVSYLLLTNQIEENDLIEFQNNSSSMLEEKRELIKETARYFHSLWLGRNSAGFGVLSNMVSSSDILVYNPKAKFPVLPLRDIFKQEMVGELPFDVVIIGTSDRYDIDFSLKTYDEVGDLFSITDQDVIKFEEAFMIDETRAKNFSVKLRKSYFEALSETGLASVIVLGKFIENPSIENQKICLQVLNSSSEMINIFGQNFSRKDIVHSFIKKYFHDVHPDMPFALTTGITNNLLLITPRESMRNSLDGLISYVSRKINFDISMPLISWIDENDDDGVIVEKWSLNGIKPNYLPNNCLYLFGVKELETSVSVMAIDNREGLESQFDLLFDEDDKKIYVNGNKVTSKELPTVAATISLFGQLLESDNFTVSSNYLPAQSYFADRNELQSKILSPLKLFIKKELHKHLSLKISGTLAEYSVCLYSSDISIGFIRRV